MIISISECDKVDNQFLQDLVGKKFQFPVKFLLSKQILTPGENRNLAAEESIGDIIITNDADDEPFFSRVEIIKYYFSKYDIDHLLHGFNYSDSIKKIFFYDYIHSDMPYFDKEKIKFQYIKSLYDLWDNSYSHRFHAGNMAIRRHVFGSVKWGKERRGQDIYYNMAITEKKFNSFYIQQPLILYRQEYSSWDKFTQKLKGKIDND
jgi:hypothetical protein